MVVAPPLSPRWFVVSKSGTYHPLPYATENGTREQSYGTHNIDKYITGQMDSSQHDSVRLRNPHHPIIQRNPDFGFHKAPLHPSCTFRNNPNNFPATDSGRGPKGLSFRVSTSSRKSNSCSRTTRGPLT